LEKGDFSISKQGGKIEKQELLTSTVPKLNRKWVYGGGGSGRKGKGSVQKKNICGGSV